LPEFLTPQALAELESLERSATAGPWEVLSDPALACTWLNAAAPQDSGAIGLFDYRSASENLANAVFAAMARNRVAALIAENRALKARVQELLDANSREVDKRVAAQTERDRAVARLKAAARP
jgi:hypothetical protein